MYSENNQWLPTAGTHFAILKTKDDGVENGNEEESRVETFTVDG